MTALPLDGALTLCFAHPAYELAAVWAARDTGVAAFQVRTRDDLLLRAAEAEVVVVSGLWSNDVLARAPRLRLVQSVSAGVDQYDQAAFRAHGVRLASAQGVNANAVSDHAMALLLSLTRLLPAARDNQARRHWRPMIGHIPDREDELAGKTMLLVGLGRIGNRIARLARAFDMDVLAVRRDPAAGAGAANEVHPFTDLPALLPRADVLVLACPLTPDTRGLIGATAFARLKPGALLVNVARGPVVDEAALVAALRSGTLAGAALDVAAEEPLPPASPLWDLPGVVVTPHTAGETRRYEANVLDILAENLRRMQDGQQTLRNQVV